MINFEFQINDNNKAKNYKFNKLNEVFKKRKYLNNFCLKDLLILTKTTFIVENILTFANLIILVAILLKPNICK